VATAGDFEPLQGQTRVTQHCAGPILSPECWHGHTRWHWIPCGYQLLEGSTMYFWFVYF